MKRYGFRDLILLRDLALRVRKRIIVSSAFLFLVSSLPTPTLALSECLDPSFSTGSVTDALANLYAGQYEGFFDIVLDSGIGSLDEFEEFSEMLVDAFPLGFERCIVIASESMDRFTQAIIQFSDTDGNEIFLFIAFFENYDDVSRLALVQISTDFVSMTETWM